jgi:hypothetical protein
LRRFPLNEWDMSDRETLANACLERGVWDHHTGLIDAYFMYDESPKFFATPEEGILVHDSARLVIRTWPEIEAQMAPKLAEAARQREQQQRKDEAKKIYTSRLPNIRKLKAMIQRINRMLELAGGDQPAIEISDEGRRALDHIRGMKADDPKFAECATFCQYLECAMSEPATGTEA